MAGNVDHLVGQTLGQYELRDLLGSGGMGAVYRAYQLNLKREVAVKVLAVNLTQEPGYVERFNREAEIAASLEHPHIVPIHDYGTQRNVSYVVMRMLTGGSLAHRLSMEPGGRPSLGEVAALLKQLASALDYAHSRGIVHRDIKAGNIVLDNHGSAYIVDFGIAKLMSSATQHTQPGQVIGTPSHMAPELWRGEDASPASDQYALGVLTYNMITGRAPFEASTPYALMNKHMFEMPTPPPAWRPDIPDAVTEVIARALGKEAFNRFPTVTAYAQAFNSAIEGAHGDPTGIFSLPLRKQTPAPAPRPPTPVSQSAPVPAAPPSRRSSPGVWIALVTLLLVIGAGIFVASQSGDGASVDARVNATFTAIAAAALPATATETVPPSVAAVVVIPTLADSPTKPPAPTNTERPAATATDIPTMDIPQTVQAALDATGTTLAQQRIDAAPSPTETPEPTATPAPTNTPEPTDTLEPTNTPAPTLTPEPTDTPVSTEVPATAVVADTGAPSITVTSGRVAVYSHPNVSSEVMGSIRSGSVYHWTGVSRNGLFYLVEFEGRLGWVAANSPLSTTGEARVLSRIPADFVSVHVGNSEKTVYQQPDINSEIIGEVSNRGLLITNSVAEGSFFQIYFDGQEGWMTSTTLAVDGDISSLERVDFGAPILIVDSTGAALRSQPDFVVTNIEGHLYGEIVEIIGVSEDNRFYQIMANGELMWVGKTGGQASGDLRDLPVVAGEQSQATSSAATARIGGLGANLYAAPTFDSDRLQSVSNVMLTITGRSADDTFYQVAHEGQMAWIANSAFLRVEGEVSELPVVDPEQPQVSAPTVHVGAVSINLYEAPRGDAQRIRGISDTTLPITGVTATGSFYQVEYAGQTLWVANTGFIEVEGDTSGLPVVEAEQFQAPTAAPDPGTPTRTPTNTPTPTPSPTQRPTATRRPTATLVPFEGTLFEDDFGDGNLNGWDYEGSAAGIVSDDGNNVVRLRANDWNGIYLQQGSTWTDYALEARVKVISITTGETPDVFFSLRRSGQGDYASYVSVERFGPGIGGTWDGEWHNINDAGSGGSFQPPLNEWFTIRFQVIGENMEFSVNNSRMSTSTNSELSRGSIGFGIAPDVEVYIDDVHVINLSGRTTVSTPAAVTVVVDSANLRSGPGTDFDPVGSALRGTSYDVVARTRDDGWYYIQLNTEDKAWIAAEVVTLDGESSGIEIAQLTEAPVLLSPASGTVFTHYPRTTTLSWQPVSGAVRYHVEIDGYDPFNGVWFDEQDDITTSSTEYTFEFVGAQPGRWRVWAVSASGQESPKSRWWEFRYTQ